MNKLMIPKTGSTACLREAYSTRPACASKRCDRQDLHGCCTLRQLCRSSESGWCSLRVSAINRSMLAALRTWMFFLLPRPDSAIRLSVGPRTLA